MAAFNNGSGDLGASTLEAAFVECALQCIIEDSQLATPTGNITDDIAPNGGSITINATIPITQTLSNGQILLAATDYLSQPFNPGTGGTLVSTTWPAALLEITSRIQSLEAAQDLNVVNLTLDTDANTATITATMNTVRTLNANGSQNIATSTYLA